MATTTHVTIFADIFKNVEALLLTFVNGTSAKVITAITPVVATALTIWLIWYAVNVLIGAERAPVGTLLKRMIVWSVVIALALTAGVYQNSIGKLIVNLPNGAASAFITGGAPTGDALGSMLDDTADAGIDKAKAIMSIPTGTFAFGDKMIEVVGGVDMLIMTVLLCVAGFFMLALATVMVAFLAAIGPLFIILALFDSTRHFFGAWVSHIAYWVVFLLLFAMIVSAVNIWYGWQVKQLVTTSSAFTWLSVLFSADVVGIFGLLAFFWIPKVAAGITGGSGGSTLAAIRGVVAGAAAAMGGMAIAGKVAGAAAGAGSAASGGQASRGAAQVASRSAPSDYNRKNA